MMTQDSWDEFVQHHGRIIGYHLEGNSDSFLPVPDSPRARRLVEQAAAATGRGVSWVYGPQGEEWRP